MADHRVVNARLRITNKITGFFRRNDPGLYLASFVGLCGMLEEVFLSATRTPFYSETYIHWSGPRLDEFVFVCDMLLEDMKEVT